MEDIIKLDSKYGIKNYLVKMKKKNGEGSKTYRLKSEKPIQIAGYIDDMHKFIKPRGSSMIVEGEILPEANAEVKYLNFVDGFGHVVTFK